MVGYNLNNALFFGENQRESLKHFCSLEAGHVTYYISLLIQGKRNPRAADPPVDSVKNPQFLVLISENFMEARAALSRSGITSLPSNQSPVKVDMASVPSVTGPPPTSIPSGCLFI
jgi:hypothetical protein